jgi:hypothetical protein
MLKGQSSRPSPDGDDGRAANGGSAVGKRFGRGNPHAQKVAQWRKAMIQGVPATCRAARENVA